MSREVTERAPVLVLGLGNRLFSDEGIGVVAAERVRSLGLSGVEVLDGGTLGLALLPEIEGRRSLLLLDALQSGDRAPGEVVSLTGDELHARWRRCLSAHQLGIEDLLGAAELMGASPQETVAVTMVPASLETGWGLSGTAEEGLDYMVEAARSVLRSWSVADA